MGRDVGKDIERLRAENNDLTRELDHRLDVIKKMRAEIERLRAEVETMNAVHKQTAHQLADYGRENKRLRTLVKELADDLADELKMTRRTN